MPRILSTTRTYTVCQACKAGQIDIDDTTTLNYFRNQKLSCPNCGDPIDWWTQILWQIQCKVPSFSLAPAGAFDTWAVVTMKPNEVMKLDLAECGVPESARILQLGYTPQGQGLFPVELHGNVPLRHLIPHTILLYGRPSGQPQSETEVLVSILWVPHSEGEEAWNNLVIAFESFQCKTYDSVIIPANVAVESKLNRVVFQALSSRVAKARVHRFLADAATYGHQLNVLLPFITSIMELPPLPDHIRGILNRLRRNRNEIAHKGNLLSPTSELEAAGYLCASFFSLVYLKQLETMI